MSTNVTLPLFSLISIKNSVAFSYQVWIHQRSNMGRFWTVRLITTIQAFKALESVCNECLATVSTYYLTRLTNIDLVKSGIIGTRLVKVGAHLLQNKAIGSRKPCL